MHFHRTPRLTREDVGGVVAVVARRIECLLERRGLAGGDESGGGADRWAEEAPVLAGIAAASVQGVVAIGARIRRCGAPPDEVEPSTLGRCHARQLAFDLHAGIVVPAGQRERLERLCRYALRPPVAQDRLRRASDGQVWLALRYRWADGTTHLRFDPIELVERLAVLTPRPRINLILYRGVLAPRAAWRSEVVEYAPSAEVHAVAVTETPRAATGGEPEAVACRAGALLWADLMRRTFGFDVLACPRCGGRMRLIALLEQAAVVQRMLRHLGLPSDVPQPYPARAPPIPSEDPDLCWRDDGAFDPCS